MLLSSLQQESGMRRRLFLQFSTHYIDIIHRIYTHCISFHILLIRNWFCIDGGNSTWKGSLRNVFAFRLVVATLGLELNPSVAHDASSQHVAVKLLLGSKAEDVEGILGVLKLLVVVDGVDLGLALRDVDVVVDVVGGTAFGTEATLANS